MINCQNISPWFLEHLTEEWRGFYWNSSLDAQHYLLFWKYGPVLCASCINSGFFSVTPINSTSLWMPAERWSVIWRIVFLMRARIIWNVNWMAWRSVWRRVRSLMTIGRSSARRDWETCLPLISGFRSTVYTVHWILRLPLPLQGTWVGDNGEITNLEGNLSPFHWSARLSSTPSFWYFIHITITINFEPSIPLSPRWNGRIGQSYWSDSDIPGIPSPFRWPSRLLMVLNFWYILYSRMSIDSAPNVPWARLA